MNAIKKTTVKLGKLSVDLVEKEEQFLGIGYVKYGRKSLRSNILPWTFYTESEAGFRFDIFTSLKVNQRRDGSVVLTFKSTGSRLPRIQEADAMGDSRIRTRRLKAPTAYFRWTLRPITENIGENEWSGMAMQLEIKSPDHPLHWVIEDATWEIGGSAASTTLIQQDVSTIDLEQKVKADSEFSTIEKFFTDGWGGSYPMDMLPRAAGAAICDFQTKEKWAICLFFEKPGLTRSRIDKHANENVIHYTDRPFVAASTHVVFPERKLLVYQHKAVLKKHEWRNLWLDCFTEVRERLCSNYGFTPEIPLPIIHSHLWDKELKQHGPSWIKPLENALPVYADLGYRHVFTHGVWNSVTSDDSPGIIGNICCPYDYAYAEKFGGKKIMRRLNDAAKKAGLRIAQWFSFQLSQNAPIWKEHPEWLVHQANGSPWNASYRELWAGKMTTEYADWIEQQILAVKEDTGIDGIFWDSYQNLGVTCIDWASPDKTPQAEAIWRLQALLQKEGFFQTCEVVTPFGVSQVALFGFDDDKFRRRLWSDTERDDSAFVLIDTAPAFMTTGAQAISAKKISPEKYFWLLGHRSVPIVSARPWEPGTYLPGGELAETYAAINKIYNRVISKMKRLRLTEEGKYTLWLDENNIPSVVWAFKETSMPFTGQCHDVLDKETHEIKGTMILKPGHVYELSPEK